TGKTIGIVGVGHVGKEVEKLCHAYGMRVLRNDPPRALAEGADGFVSLDVLAEEADILTFHTPLTRDGAFATYHLAGEAFLSKLKRSPWFINASRGAVHDTDALLQAKQSGQVGELIIDCWENEPNINRTLLASTALATPHIAGFSADGKANGTRTCLRNIADYFRIPDELIGEVAPPAPHQPEIDLDSFADHRIEQMILSSFNPLTIDYALRNNPEQFESFRTHYDHPREFAAYTPLHATTQEAGLLRQLGFAL
ncbi:MAG: NAD(P)-dependent oxidoreductase, partial [Tannerellaceae bacterium]